MGQDRFWLLCSFLCSEQFPLLFNLEASTGIRKIWSHGPCFHSAPPASQSSGLANGDMAKRRNMLVDFSCWDLRSCSQEPENEIGDGT